MNPPLSLAVGLVLICATLPLAAGDLPVDWSRNVVPLLAAHCSGGACHIGGRASGVDFSSYPAAIASAGDLYGRAPILPYSAAMSPLYDKVARAVPEHGVRMPSDGAALSAAEIALVARWIDEGARPAAVLADRGDVDPNRVIDISDAIRLLQFLFLGGAPPRCTAVADADLDGRVTASDAIAILDWLFHGVDAFSPRAPLSWREDAECAGTNRRPRAPPLGTMLAREGIAFETEVPFSDPDGDRASFFVVDGPDGLTVDPTVGVLRFTPRDGQAGDHRIRVAIVDRGTPPLLAETTGLVRVAIGNRAPRPDAFETRFVRAEETLEITFTASDPDGDALIWSLVAGPDASTLDPPSGRLRWTPMATDVGEHALVAEVRDDGVPARTATIEVTIVVLSSDATANRAPTIDARAIHRTVPGQPIAFVVEASDPDGDAIAFRTRRAPLGAILEPATGAFTWTPREDQLGPAYVLFDVVDDGVPPHATEGRLVFQIFRDGGCVTLDCDPASGCATTLVSLDAECCGGEPTLRIAEPVADCPGGAVLHAGRNQRGFGRLQNCDRLGLVAFPQGGSNLRIHVEARCVDASRDVTLFVRLVTAKRVVVDRQRTILLQERSDGFAQRLGVVLPIGPEIARADIDGEPADLDLELIDANGTRLERHLRVVLTFDDIPDLHEPDAQDVAAGEVGCAGCHRPVGSDGTRHGIEDAHPWLHLSCTDCHGGVASANTRESAHVRAPAGLSYLRNLTTDELDAAPASWLQFVNPSDLRVADRGCGASSPANNGGGCHQSIVDAVARSVMSTYAGHYTPPRFLAGTQGRDAIVAAVDRSDRGFDPDTAPEGTVPALRALREPAPGIDRASIGACIDIYLPKSCPTCHLSDFGRNDAAGNYRSSGCAACHMVYDDDGLSRSADPTIARDFPPHPREHVLTSAIPTEQCAHCHFESGRIGLAFRGLREGGFPAARTPEHGVTLGKELHAHDSDHYFSDEDGRNAVDETPADLHHTAGMVCADCHVGIDVHGDGRIYVSERFQVGIRCEDCHGTVREALREDPADGLFKNSRGSPLGRLLRRPDGRVALRLRTDGRELDVPQVHTVIASGVNQAMTEAMGVDASGFSHTDSLECYACHTSWRQTCFGCHITIDDSRSQLNRTTGVSTQGAVAVTRDDYSIDFFALGENHRGKIAPLCSSMAVFVSYTGDTGTSVYDDRVRTSSDGRRGFGWSPFHHHTVSRVPENCDRCHPALPGSAPENRDVLRETYGFGNGRFQATDGDGVVHDLSAFLGDDGELLSEFPHPGTGPVSAAARARALGVEVVPHPRR